MDTSEATKMTSATDEEVAEIKQILSFGVGSRYLE